MSQILPEIMLLKLGKVKFHCSNLPLLVPVTEFKVLHLRLNERINNCPKKIKCH